MTPVIIQSARQASHAFPSPHNPSPSGLLPMYLVAIAWVYVVLMMAVAEAVSSQGTVLGGIITFVLYGVLPLTIVMYVMGTPTRRRARLAAEEQAQATAASEPAASQDAAATAVSGPAPDGSGHAPGGLATGVLAPERKEV